LEKEGHSAKNLWAKVGERLLLFLSEKIMQPTFNDVKAESIRNALLLIAEKYGGYLNPAHVVDEARDSSHYLHEHFEWDDSVAAESYRLAQAGALIRKVKLTIIRKPEATKEIEISTTRAYQSRESQRTSSGGYEPIEAIMSDENKREELMQQVLRELSAYRKRYADIVALADVWAAIDDATELHASAAPARQVEAGQARCG
jgi:hypothetical protein